MDEKKVCFIMCTNDEMYETEARYFISKLYAPEGFSIDCFCVKDAASMTSGYNEAMQVSDAKYKVYIHQDVFIIENHFIEKMLDIFKDKSVGMFGMIGAQKMPENMVMWEENRIGKIYSSNVGSIQEYAPKEVSGSYESAEAIDGLLMATQYDLPWREDIFDKWDFYDVSQSYEFRKKGYKVVVPNMDKPWCIHDDGFSEIRNYYSERRKFLKLLASES